MHKEKKHLKHDILVPFLLITCPEFEGAQCDKKDKVTLELFPNPSKSRVNDGAFGFSEVESVCGAACELVSETKGRVSVPHSCCMWRRISKFATSAISNSLLALIIILP